MKWWRRLRREQESDDDILGWTRWSIGVRVGGRPATVGAEMLNSRWLTTHFVVYRDDIRWDDGGEVSEADRERILRVLQERAKKKNRLGLEFE